MVAFVIFWAAVLAIVFFILQLIFKALTSIFAAILSSLDKVLKVAVGIGAAVLVLVFALTIVDGIARGEIGNLIVIVILSGIAIAVGGALIFAFGAAILGVIAVVADKVLNAISFGLDKAGILCEKGYIKFLTVIMKRLDQC